MKTLWIVVAGAVLTLLLVFIGCGTVNQGSGAEAEEPSGPTGEGVVGDVGGGGEDAPPEGESQPAAVGGGACTTDADCVPAECCHPKTCTVKASAPDCSEMMCTLDCRAGTMDCGWGKCICQDGQCAAEINPPPKPPIKADPKMGVQPLPE